MKKITKVIIISFCVVLCIASVTALCLTSGYTDATLNETVAKAESLSQNFSEIISYESYIWDTETDTDPISDEKLNIVEFALSTRYALRVVYNSSNEIIASQVVEYGMLFELCILTIGGAFWLGVMIFLVADCISYSIKLEKKYNEVNEKEKSGRVKAFFKKIGLFKKTKKGETQNDEENNGDLDSAKLDDSVNDDNSVGNDL